MAQPHTIPPVTAKFKLKFLFHLGEIKLLKIRPPLMYPHKIVVLAEMVVTHLKTYYLLKHFHFLVIVKIMLLNRVVFWRQEVLTQQYKSVKNPAGQHLGRASPVTT